LEYGDVASLTGDFGLAVWRDCCRSGVAGGDAALPARSDPRLIEVAREARQTIAVIDWFYVRHRACPQPSRPAELVALQDGLGDGFSVDLEGQFVAIRGIA
jgi:hypothetical protein